MVHVTDFLLFRDINSPLIESHLLVTLATQNIDIKVYTCAGVQCV